MAKISIQDIAKVIASKHGLPQSDAERFVAALFEVINDGLNNEKIVKVKGLGTFKVIDVRERESVNVNTGERVVIESHGKITFTPDPIMRDLVNKPFAQFETVILNDGVDLNEMSNTQGAADEDTVDNEDVTKTVQDADIVATDDDMQDSVSAGDTETTPEETATVDVELENDIEAEAEETATGKAEDEPECIELKQSEMTVLDEVPVLDEVANEADKEIEKVVDDDSRSIVQNQESDFLEDENRNTVGETVSNEKKIVVGAEQRQNDDECLPRQDESRKNDQSSYKWALNTILVLLACAVSLIIGYYWGVSSVKPIVRYKTVNIVGQPTIKTDSVRKTDVAAPVSQGTETVKEEKNAVVKETSQTVADNVPELGTARAMVRTGAYRITGTAKTVTVKKGETMKAISKFYLGDGMECYVQIHNGITDVKEGMKLKIPKLELKKKK